MSEQVVDLKSVWAVLRRHWKTLLLATLLGAALGAGVMFLRPPMWTSTSMVLFPAGSGTNSGHDIETQAQIAESVSVLGPAGERMTPPMSVGEVKGRVTVAPTTDDVLQFTIEGETAAEAEALATAVAYAHIGYLDQAASALSEDQRSALSDRRKTLSESLARVDTEIQKTNTRLNGEPKTSQQGLADAAALAELTAQRAKYVLQLDALEDQVTAGRDPQTGQSGGGATVIQDASPAVRDGLVERLAIYADIGAGAFLLAAGAFFVLRERRDQRLRLRDHIADAIGIPVVASIEGRAHRSATAWSELIQGYDPGNVDRWALRQLLRLVTPGTPGNIVRKPDLDAESQPVVVLSLSGDQAALAAGPQFASFVASLGIRTELVPAQPHGRANSLWAACSSPPGRGEARPGLSLSVGQKAGGEGDLVVMVAVLDRRDPELYLLQAENAVTLLAVSAGFATAEDLANVAVAADYGHYPIDGIVVVNPDPLDRTSGRLMPADRVQQVPLPTLMTGRAVGESGRPAVRGKSHS